MNGRSADRPGFWLPLSALLAAVFMELLDFSIVNIAIPRIQSDLHAGNDAVQWIVAGYSVAFATVLITGARLGDIHGRRRVFLVGMGGFMGASLLCGLATSAGMLIVSRMLQGAAGAVMMPQILSIIQVAFPAGRRVTAISSYSAVAGIATVAGPLVGAVLIDADVAQLGWRSIFLVNLLIGGVALAVGWSAVPESRLGPEVRLDLPGVVLLSLALMGSFVPLIEGRASGWPPVWLATLGIGALMVGVFVRYETHRSRSGRSPLVELGLFRNGVFVVGLVVGLVFFGIIMSFYLVSTVLLQDGLGYSVMRAGLTWLPFSLGVVAGAGVAGQYSTSHGRRLVSIGAVTMAGALALLWLVVHHEATAVTSWELGLPLACVGACIGLIVVPIVDFVLSPVAPPEVGSASGLVNMTQPVGGAAGVAVVGGLFFCGPAGCDLVASYQRAIMVDVALLLVVWGLVFLLPARRAHTGREAGAILVEREAG